MAENVALAYSGGLDTSLMLRWIEEKYGYDTALATCDALTAFDQTQSNGFLEISAMPTVLASARKREHPNKPMRYRVAAKSATQARKAK
jgi:argininosuccinate synthase